MENFGRKKARFALSMFLVVALSFGFAPLVSAELNENAYGELSVCDLFNMGYEIVVVDEVAYLLTPQEEYLVIADAGFSREVTEMAEQIVAMAVESRQGASTRQVACCGVFRRRSSTRQSHTVTTHMIWRNPFELACFITTSVFHDTYAWDCRIHQPTLHVRTVVQHSHC